MLAQLDRLVSLEFKAMPEGKARVLQFDIGGASAGGIVAVILANIVAIFLVRIVGKNLEA